MIYEKLKELRILNNYTQEEIANQLLITQPQYQLYESGKREIKPNLLINLADFYNVSLDYIAGRTEKKEINK